MLVLAHPTKSNALASYCTENEGTPCPGVFYERCIVKARMYQPGFAIYIAFDVTEVQCFYYLKGMR